MVNTKGGFDRITAMGDVGGAWNASARKLGTMRPQFCRQLLPVVRCTEMDWA